MKYLITLLFLVGGLFITTTQAQEIEQAQLKIENNSSRIMTVKVMNGIDKGKLYKTVQISPYKSNTIYFSESGSYFTKTKAILKDKKPVYRKGKTFNVINDDTGYSVMTLTFSITESTIAQATGGKEISEKEFELNN